MACIIDQYSNARIINWMNDLSSHISGQMPGYKFCMQYLACYCLRPCISLIFMNFGGVKLLIYRITNLNSTLIQVYMKLFSNINFLLELCNLIKNSFTLTFFCLLISGSRTICKEPILVI